MSTSENWSLKIPLCAGVDVPNKRKIYLRQICVLKSSKADQLESLRKPKRKKFKLFKTSDFSLEHGVWKNSLKKKSTPSIMAIYKASIKLILPKKKKSKKTPFCHMASATGIVEISKNSCKHWSCTLKRWLKISQTTSAPKPLKKLELIRMYSTKILINSMIVSKSKKCCRDATESTISKSQLLSWSRLKSLLWRDH